MFGPEAWREAAGEDEVGIPCLLFHCTVWALDIRCLPVKEDNLGPTPRFTERAYRAASCSNAPLERIRFTLVSYFWTPLAKKNGENTNAMETCGPCSGSLKLCQNGSRAVRRWCLKNHAVSEEL